ncbi:MAG TPA: ABC transporter permease subunit [Pirellulales bacterium]|nr:ABC transporter permease subunit [Pirellulales bacterium]
MIGPNSEASLAGRPAKFGWQWIVVCLFLLLAIWALAVGDARTTRLALNTLWLMSAVVGLSVPLGCLLALLLARTDVPGRRVVVWLLAGFLFFPLHVQAGAWQAALGSDGWLTSYFSIQPLVAGWRGAIWVHAAAALPWVVLIVAVGLSSVERELEEQALLDGSAWQVVLRVTFRRSAGAIFVAALWGGLVAAREMAVTDFFQVRTFAEELYTAYALGDEPVGVGRGMALTGSLLVGVLLLAAGLIPMTRRGSPFQMLVFNLGSWRWCGAAAVLTVAAILVLLPLISLAQKAGAQVINTPTGRARTWSAKKCATMVTLNPRIDGRGVRFRHQTEIGWSLAIDSCAATAALLIGLPVAWFARRGTWRAWAGLASVVWLWAVPGPIIGLAIIALMNRPEIPLLIRLYDETITPLVLGCLAHSLPLATLILWSSFRSIPDELLEAAELEGAGWWRRLWLVVLPLRWPALVLAWVVAFVWSLGELDASELVAPPGVRPLSIHLFGLLHFGAQDQVAALCLALYIVVQSVGVGAWWLVRKMSAAVRGVRT